MFTYLLHLAGLVCPRPGGGWAGGVVVGAHCWVLRQHTDAGLVGGFVSDLRYFWFALR